jgi:hypothetical protein
MSKELSKTRAVLKTVAGMAVTSPKDLIKLAAHAGDHLLKGEISQALTDTYVFYVNKGEIDPKYFDSTKFADLAPEFGRVQNEAHGIDKLNMLRRIFVNLARDNGDGSHRKYLLDVALDMSEPEIKVLIADMELAKQTSISGLRSSAKWLDEIASTSGLKHTNLVEIAEKSLIERGLLTPRHHSDGSGTYFETGKGRLTTMGWELCELTVLEDDPVKEI